MYDDEIENQHEQSQTLYAEQCILGSIICDGASWDTIADKLNEGHFTVNQHRVIFSAMKEMVKADQIIDLITLDAWLKNIGRLEEAGGFYNLGRLAQFSHSASNVQHYIKMLHQNSLLANMRNVAAQLMTLADGSNLSPTELKDKLDELLGGIDQGPSWGKGPQGANHFLAKMLETIDSQSKNLVPTGFTEFDKILDGGMRPGELIVAAGRPGMGKTAFAMNIAEYVTLKLQKAVLIFTQEMSGESLLLRMVASLTQIPMHKLKIGQLQEHDWTRLTSVVGMLSKSKLIIDETPALRPSELRMRARRVARETGNLSLIIVDYIGLMKGDRHFENKVHEIAQITGALKALAKELDIPILALAQLNRNSVNRPVAGEEGKRFPTMADLRDSGAIEQDSDVVALIYRDEVMNKDSKHKGMADIIIDKHRSGATGSFELAFVGHCAQFRNVEPTQTFAPYVRRE